MERDKSVDMDILEKLIGDEFVNAAVKNAALISDKDFVSQLEDFIYDDLAKKDCFWGIAKKRDGKDLQKYYENIDNNTTLMNQLIEAELPNEVVVDYFWKFDRHLKELLKK